MTDSVYLTRPLAVQAKQWDGSDAQFYLIVGWVLDNDGVAWPQDPKVPGDGKAIGVETPNGAGFVHAGDWVVKTPQGHFIAVKGDEFDGLYEKPSVVAEAE